jgi:integrase
MSEVISTPKSRKHPQRTHRTWGRVRTLPSGRHQASYVDPDGVTQNAPYTFDTKATANIWLSKQQTAIVTGDWTQANATEHKAKAVGKQMILKDMAREWREMRRNRRGQPLSPNTMHEYERLIEKVLAPLASKPIRSITEADVERWWKVEEKAHPNQASKAYGHLRSLMAYALRKKWIDHNPAAIDGAGSYRPNTEVEVPTDEQVDKMIAAANDTWKALLNLAAFGGFRKSEMLELRPKNFLIKVEEDGRTWIDVDIAHAVVWTKGVDIVSKPKTRKSVRLIRMPQRANDAILAHLEKFKDPEALLFPSVTNSERHLSAGSFADIWYPIRAAAGYNGRFHSLRAFHLTRFAVAGATDREIMDRGGHADIKVAMRYQRSIGRDVSLLDQM